MFRTLMIANPQLGHSDVDIRRGGGLGPYKEQKHMDSRVGVDNLDNKRREVNPRRMEELEKMYGDE